MRWIPPPSICACRCFRGRSSESTKPPSKCTRCSTCTATSPRSSASRMARLKMSTSSMRSFPRPAPSNIMNRGYIDFERLYVFTLSSAFFVVRTKEKVLLQRLYSHPVDKSTGVRSDHTVILTTIESAKAYPDTLRRITYFDAESNQRMKFLHQQLRAPRTYHHSDLQVPL